VFGSFALRDCTFVIKSAWKAIWTEIRNRAGEWLSRQPKSYGDRSTDLVERGCWLGILLRRMSNAAILASSDVVADGVFQENCAVSLPVICQPKSLLLPKLRDLCLPIFFSYRPDALQVLLVDSAVPQIVSLELQLIVMCVGFTNCTI
jgi:hypothetical protein